MINYSRSTFLLSFLYNSENLCHEINFVYRKSAFRSKNLLSIAKLQAWVVITPERQRRDAEGFVDMIMKTGNGVGFRLPKPDLGTF